MIDTDEDVIWYPGGVREAPLPKREKSCREIPEPDGWRPLGYEW